MTYALLTLAVVALLYGVRHARKDNFKRALAGFTVFAAIAVGTCATKIGLTEGPSQGTFTRDDGIEANNLIPYDSLLGSD